MKNSRKIFIPLLAVLMSLGVFSVVSAQGVWIAPDSPPGTADVAPPINPGGNSQYKEGVVGATKVFTDKEMHSWSLTLLGKTLLGKFKTVGNQIVGEKKDGSYNTIPGLRNESGASLYVIQDMAVAGDSSIGGNFSVIGNAKLGNTSTGNSLTATEKVKLSSLATDGGRSICVNDSGKLILCGAIDKEEEEDGISRQERMGRYLASMITYRGAVSDSGAEEEIRYDEGIIIATAKCQHNPSQGVYELLLGGGGSCGGAKGWGFGEMNRSHPMSSGANNIFSDYYLGERVDDIEECDGLWFGGCSHGTAAKWPFWRKNLAHQGIDNPWSRASQKPWVPENTGYMTPEEFEEDEGEALRNALSNTNGFIDSWFVQCDAAGAQAYAYAICLPIKVN